MVLIIDIYGCFMFYSGLLCNGCLGLDDMYVLYGEMLCVLMDCVSFVVGVDVCGVMVEVIGEYEYV